MSSIMDSYRTLRETPPTESHLSSVLNRLSPIGLLLLLADTVSSLAVSGNRSLPNLLPVLGRLPGLTLVVVQLIDLLESHVFGLVNEEVDKEHCDPSEAAPNPEDVGLSRSQSTSKVWRDK